MKINFKNKFVRISDVRECKGINQAIGLMFSRRQKANALSFKFSKPTKMAIHSFFVFFPFLAIWLDEKNKILEIRRVRPFKPRVSSAQPYFKLLEIPINNKYKKTLAQISKSPTRIQKI